MSDEDKKTLSYRLSKLVREISELAKDADCTIDIYATNSGASTAWLHYDKRMVALFKQEDIDNAFFIERNDLVKEDKKDER